VLVVVVVINIVPHDNARRSRSGWWYIWFLLSSAGYFRMWSGWGEGQLVTFSAHFPPLLLTFIVCLFNLLLANILTIRK
jgi:hypothetical protein